jgi:hypothetical protein
VRSALCAPSMSLPDWALTWLTWAGCTDRHARHRNAASPVAVLASGVVGIVRGACGRLHSGCDRTRNEAVGTALVEKQAAQEVGRKPLGATWRAGAEVGEAEAGLGASGERTGEAADLAVLYWRLERVAALSCGLFVRYATVGYVMGFVSPLRSVPMPARWASLAAIAFGVSGESLGWSSACWSMHPLPYLPPSNSGFRPRSSARSSDSWPR